MRKQFFTRRTKQAAKGGCRTAQPGGFSEQNFQKLSTWKSFLLSTPVTGKEKKFLKDSMSVMTYCHPGEKSYKFLR